MKSKVRVLTSRSRKLIGRYPIWRTMMRGRAVFGSLYRRTVRYLPKPVLVPCLAGCLLTTAIPGAISSPSRVNATDVQLIGLTPLYEALVAVANCPNLAIDQATFARAARLYYLKPADFTASGAFPREIAALDRDLTLRLNDDRDAFCSRNRLSSAVLYGVLIDRGDVYPHPLGQDPARSFHSPHSAERPITPQ